MHFIKGFMTMTELRVAYFRIGFEDEYDEFLSLMNSFPALKSLELRLVRRLPAYHQVSVFRALTPAPRLKTLQFEGCMLFEGLANVGELRLVTEMMLRSVSSTLETLIPKAYYFGNIALGDVDYVAFIGELLAVIRPQTISLRQWTCPECPTFDGWSLTFNHLKILALATLPRSSMSSTEYQVSTIPPTWKS
uniref:Uncharacterized protein n=1 Tax=Moniliophthora roreri TaxID=221103 RepID=A0A0W0GDL7_MONRR